MNIESLARKSVTFGNLIGRLENGDSGGGVLELTKRGSAKLRNRLNTLISDNVRGTGISRDDYINGIINRATNVMGGLTYTDYGLSKRYCRDVDDYILDLSDLKYGDDFYFDFFLQ